MCNMVRLNENFEKFDKQLSQIANTKQSLGQFYTTNGSLKEKVFEYILNKPDVILEPSFGRGDLVKYTQDEFKKNGKVISYDMYEIDKNTLMDFNELGYILFSINITFPYPLNLYRCHVIHVIHVII